MVWELVAIPVPLRGFINSPGVLCVCVCVCVCVCTCVCVHVCGVCVCVHTSIRLTCPNTRTQ